MCVDSGSDIGPSPVMIYQQTRVDSADLRCQSMRMLMPIVQVCRMM